MKREELMKLEEMIWRFKLERQLECSKEEEEALVTTLILIIKELKI
jgi:hypothetical protein